MTFDDLDNQLRTKLEQLAFDAGCAWIEEFRDERERDPEPEECDEQAEATADSLQPQVHALFKAYAVEPEPALLRSVRSALQREFVGALEV